MAQYWSIKADYPDAILFFRLGDFYEMFGPDAQKAAAPLEVVLTMRQGIPMCGVPYHASAGYIKKLIKAGFKVAVCEQLEEAGVSKGIVKRGVTRVITPGTIFEDSLLEARQNNYLMSVYFDAGFTLASIAAADISTGSFFTLQTSFKDLQSEILKYSPGEILTPLGTAENQTLQNVLNQTQVSVSTFDETSLTPQYSQTLVTNQFGGGFLKKLNFKNNEIALTSVAALLQYLHKTQSLGFGAFSEAKIINNADYMRLDAAAVENLEILTSNSGAKEGSLLGAIDATITPMGSRKFRAWAIKPLLNLERINARYASVEFFMKASQGRRTLRDNFKTLADIERITSRVQNGTANPKEMVSLKNSLITLKNTALFLKSNGASGEIETLGETFLSNDEIINKIEITLNEEAPLQLKDGGIIRSGVNKDLDELRNISNDVKKFISGLEEQERKKTGINNLKIGYTSVFGYYIEITKSNISQAPEHYIRKQTLTNCERYITQELKNLEETILSAQEKTLRLETELFAELKNFIVRHAAQINKTADSAAELDVYASNAEIALNNNYVRPVLTNTSVLNITGARHPVIELILKSGEFVSNDISLDGAGKRVVILTGPNMSGKSTYLRQTALIVIMAQMGCFVPAASAEIGVCDAIFTRIGAGDN
ncbi:MAG: DNA mismatch repair protein MutS, partial [Elusimicrobia bacterium]|nr:DNA mismatch repair protein MutS [Elusimicrobiota bacterium]